MHPEDERPALLRWAIREFERTHHIHLFGHIDADNDFQALGDMLLENPKVKGWLRSAGTTSEAVARSESFEDLINRLTLIRRYDPEGSDLDRY